MTTIRKSSILNVVNSDNDQPKTNVFEGVNQLLLAADFIERKEKMNAFVFRYKSDPSIVLDSTQTMVNEKDVSETSTIKQNCDTHLFPIPEFTSEFTVEHFNYLKNIYWTIPTQGPFICSVRGCHKEFNRKDNLKCHIKTHIPNRNRPFECARCERGYLRHVDLMRHIETVHLGVRRHFCSKCNKAFTRKEGLRIHSERCY